MVSGKKWGILLLCILALGFLHPKAAAADSGVCGDQLTWSIDDQGTLTISGTGDMYGYSEGEPFWKDASKPFQTLVLESGVTSVGQNAFRLCAGLTAAVIPGSVARMEDAAFAACESLKEIRVSDENEYFSSVDGVLFDKGQKTLLAFPGGRTGGYIVPGGVTAVASHAFLGCAGLTDVTMLSGVASIGWNAFSDCPALACLVVPDSVAQAGNGLSGSVADNCPALRDVYYSGDADGWNALQRGGGMVPAGAAVHFRFEDVPSGAYYADAVNWAVAHGITNGVSETAFSPGNTCTTANIITFLWRAAGSPEPQADNPFTDVPAGQYYTKAAVWAHENGLIAGRIFSGGSPCTRAATMKYLWVLSGRPKAGASPFTDIPKSADYAQAVSWAVANGVTNGTSETKFSPNSTCTRGQIAAFLLRYYQI